MLGPCGVGRKLAAENGGFELVVEDEEGGAGMLLRGTGGDGLDG